MRIVLAIAVAAFLSACKEIPQDTVKPFAAGEEAKTNADRLTQRTDFQNDYLRTGNAKK